MTNIFIQEVESYKQSGEKLPITKFIKSAVKQRLMMNSEYIKAGVWGEGLALLAQPSNIQGIKCYHHANSVNRHHNNS